jgi:hypothetical protein
MLPSWLLQWAKKNLRRTTAQVPRPRNRVQLGIEVLEDRRLMSGFVVINGSPYPVAQSSGTWTFNGVSYPVVQTLPTNGGSVGLIDQVGRDSSNPATQSTGTGSGFGASQSSSPVTGTGGFDAFTPTTQSTGTITQSSSPISGTVGFDGFTPTTQSAPAGSAGATGQIGRAGGPPSGLSGTVSIGPGITSSDSTSTGTVSIGPGFIVRGRAGGRQTSTPPAQVSSVPGIGGTAGTGGSSSDSTSVSQPTATDSIQLGPDDGVVLPSRTQINRRVLRSTKRRSRLSSGRNWRTCSRPGKRSCWARRGPNITWRPTLTHPC